MRILLKVNNVTYLATVARCDHCGAPCTSNVVRATHIAGPSLPVAELPYLPDELEYSDEHAGAVCATGCDRAPFHRGCKTSDRLSVLLDAAGDLY